MEVPEGLEVTVCRGNFPSPVCEPESEVEKSLKKPIESPSFEEIFGKKKQVVIVVNDHTRPVPNELLLTPILSALHRLGIPESRIHILVATGGHRPSTPEEITLFLGKHIAKNYPILIHDAWDENAHITVGTFPDGSPIRIERRYVEAEGKITIGLIEPHLMAGFSGGRKVVCPGLADVETLKCVHSPELLDHPNASPGILAGNPVHEYCLLAEKFAGCDFSLSVVLDDHRRILGVFSGHPLHSFLAGCQYVSEFASAPVPYPADLTITSSAGHPLDTTFYQAIKGLVAPLPILRQDGFIALAASLSEGLGSPHFVEIYQQVQSLQDFYLQITRDKRFWKDQWQVQEQVKVARKAKIYVYSPFLSPATLLQAFVTPLTSVQEAIRFYQNNVSRSFHLAILPDGPYVLPYLTSGSK